jgi:hypothetical protein
MIFPFARRNALRAFVADFCNHPDDPAGSVEPRADPVGSRH